MIWANNPLENPIFIPVLIRLGVVLLGGFILVLFFNLKKLSKMFQSETWKRYLGWLIMIPPFLLSVFSGGMLSLLFVSFLMYRAIKEYAKMVQLPHFYHRIILFNGLLSIILAVLFPKFIGLLPVLYFLIIVLFSILRNQLEDILIFVSFSLFGSIWLCFTLIHFLLIGRLGIGPNLLVLIGCCVAFADIFAFCFGKLFDKLNFGVNYKIASLISPNKTYAGALGNIAGATTGVLIFGLFIPNTSLNGLFVLAIIIGLASVLGDMSESMIKRFSDVKDSSALIVGHGGILDRMDSFFIVIVACYYYLSLFGKIL